MPEKASEALDGLARIPRRSSATLAGRPSMSSAPVDPDAQMFRKLGRAPILGHKVHFLVAGLLDQHRRALGRPPRELVGDRGYGSETAIRACLEREVQPLLGVRAITNPHGGLSRDDFTYLVDRDVYVCPQGKELRCFTENIFRHQTIYKPSAGTCKGCPLRARCAPGIRDRVITRRWDQAASKRCEHAQGPGVAEPNFAGARWSASASTPKPRSPMGSLGRSSVGARRCKSRPSSPPRPSISGS